MSDGKLSYIRKLDARSYEILQYLPLGRLVIRSTSDIYNDEFIAGCNDRYVRKGSYTSRLHLQAAQHGSAFVRIGTGSDHIARNGDVAVAHDSDYEITLPEALGWLLASVWQCFLRRVDPGQGCFLLALIHDCNAVL